MKSKNALILLAVLTLISCREISSKQAEEENLTEEASPAELPETYAEISIKEGGQWIERKYVGGKYQNKLSVEIPKNHTDHSNFIRYEGPGLENSKIGYRFISIGEMQSIFLEKKQIPWCCLSWGRRI